MQAVFKFRTTLLAASAVAALSTSALAQDQDSSPAPASGTQSTADPSAPFVVAVEQVLVTARRREENAAAKHGRGLPLRVVGTLLEFFYLDVTERNCAMIALQENRAGLVAGWQA